jgi:O-methyltransferase
MSNAGPRASSDGAAAPHPLRNWPTPPPDRYLGQTDAAFQRRLAEQSSQLTLEDCDWYHTTELPDGTVIFGQWDLQGHESEYLGNVPLDGRRVLEAGPASGFLTYWMEGRGADVTSFEAGYDVGFDYVPAVDGADYGVWQADFMKHIARVNNSWWLQHRDRASAARIVYGDIYNLPEDLGTFDVSVFGSILLHLRDPFRALQQAAAHTDQTMVVTDLLHAGFEDADDAVLRWGMDTASTGPSHSWWCLSPGAVTRMLWRLGFGRTQLTTYVIPRDFGTGAQDFPHFTVVAERQAHRPEPPTTRAAGARPG